ncbi:hypothetical protein BWQ96_07792 [Gracilariopsis chorda]|nr:hypothetical protein BWQ96_07792 [Gracilariopsis chorda]|eukprot:PXF42483.1 hypothetical protein BWQ96_07792 [Gracilariopsis chorda]
MDEIDVIKEECDVPPVVAYCLDLIHLGNNLQTNSSRGNRELQQLVEEVPLGMCAWGDWAGKVAADVCVQVLIEYAAAEEEEEGLSDVENDTNTVETTSRFFRWFTRGSKQFVKSFGRRAKKSTDRVGRTVRRVAKVCRRRNAICEGVTELGVNLLPVPTIPNLFNLSVF